MGKFSVLSLGLFPTSLPLTFKYTKAVETKSLEEDGGCNHELREKKRKQNKMKKKHGNTVDKVNRVSYSHLPDALGRGLSLTPFSLVMKAVPQLHHLSQTTSMQSSSPGFSWQVCL